MFKSRTIGSAPPSSYTIQVTANANTGPVYTLNGPHKPARPASQTRLLGQEKGSRVWRQSWGLWLLLRFKTPSLFPFC